MSGFAFAPRRLVLPGVRVPYLVAFASAAAGAGLARAVTTTYLPVLLDRIANAPALIGAVMLVNAAAGFGVPLVVGVWSDRLRARGTGRTRPFVWGGALVTAGGLAATALGASSSYVVLALTGAVVYIGLNALTTAHRALVPELFSPEARAKATSAQELALLGGGLVGLAVGGALTAISLWAPFLLAAVLVPLLALPTVTRVTETTSATSGERESRPLRLLPLDRAPARRALLPSCPVAVGAGLCRAADLLRALRRARAGPERRHGFRAAGRVRRRDRRGDSCSGTRQDAASASTRCCCSASSRSAAA